ncbi:LptA/OstA family protein [Sinimarinibacterium thermocellulolyticum]|uniref:LptA/OstA family protein n=1 Tax=Sinimarinibacterium thermocellulolyticum TaxID=3170016 RepID=A0ABV2AEX3_9GAMM
MCCATERLRRLGAAALLALATIGAHAQAPTPTPADDTRALRPTGPVTLTANRGEWTEGGEMRYEGNVALESDTLKLSGERMIVTQHADGSFVAQILGAPARLDHRAREGAQGIAGQSVTAEGERIDYDSRSGVVQLQGRARLLRGGDEVAGERIDYIIAERRVRASGGRGQVRIVIQPPARGETATPSPTPTPEAPAP